MTELIALSTVLFLRTNAVARSTPWLHAPAAAFAVYGIAVFALLLVAAVWARRAGSDRGLAAAVWAGLGTLLAVAVNQPVASAVAEARPYATHQRVLVLVARTTDWSFPSDHSVMAGACAVGLLIASRRLGALAVLAALLLAASRVYVGAHYPHDVAAGLLLGAFVAGLGWLVVSRPLTWLVGRARRLPGAARLLAPHPERAAVRP